MSGERHDLEADPVPRAARTGPHWRPDSMLHGLHATEIAILVAVAAILAALAVPWWFGLRERKTAAASAVNLRQWGIALNLSFPDQANTLPWDGVPLAPDHPRGAEAWYNMLPPYLSQKGISEMAPSELPRWSHASVWINPGVDKRDAARLTPPVFTYAMNRRLRAGGEDAVERLRITEVNSPGTTVFLAETLGTQPGIEPEDARAFFGPKRGPKGWGNVLFCDGHVERVGRALLDPALHPGGTNAAAPDPAFSWVP